MDSTQRNVLYLVHRFPYPPDKGDRIRAFHIIEYLQSRCALTVVTLDDSGVARRDVRSLASYCDRLEVVPAARWPAARGLWNLAGGGSATIGAFRSRAFHDTVGRVVAETRPDAVLLSSSGLAESLNRIPRAATRRVVDLVDLDSEKWRGYADHSQGLKRLLYAAEARRLNDLERQLLRRADALTLVTDSETRLCRRRCGDGPIHTVTNGARPAGPAAPWPEEDSLVFVGALDYRPNVEGVLWFCEHVWPAVHSAHPRLALRVVGREPDRALRRMRVPGVEIVGAVPDVRTWLDAATISVAPLQIARGLQNKVLEAMAAGRAVVASQGAAEGIMARPGKDFLVAESPVEWIAALDRLIGNRPLQQELAQAGRAYVAREHDWSRCLSKLPELLGLNAPEIGNQYSKIEDRLVPVGH